MVLHAVPGHEVSDSHALYFKARRAMHRAVGSWGRGPSPVVLDPIPGWVHLSNMQAVRDPRFPDHLSLCQGRKVVWNTSEDALPGWRARTCVLKVERVCYTGVAISHSDNKLFKDAHILRLCSLSLHTCYSVSM